MYGFGMFILGCISAIMIWTCWSNPLVAIFFVGSKNWRQLDNQWECLSKFLFTSGHDISKVVYFCSNNPWIARWKVTTFCKMSRKWVEGCGVLFWGFPSHISSDCKSNKQWNREVIVDVLMACVVLHNMIIENEVGENI